MQPTAARVQMHFLFVGWEQKKKREKRAKRSKKEQIIMMTMTDVINTALAAAPAPAPAPARRTDGAEQNKGGGVEPIVPF